ncbi:MAG: ATPase [Erysipelothrix sp.]|nr:ATPase [Erysipelothrix sp.]
MLYLGIDGGGTKTEFILIDEQGNIKANVIKPTSHYKQTSFDNFKLIIESGINEICEKSSIKIVDIEFTLLGLAGYGALSKDKVKIDKIVSEILKSDKFKCVADSEVAWAGSLALQQGINIVAGTGAIGFAQDTNNNSARASGWGDLIGDEGSAYWLSIKMLSLFAKQADGRIEKTPLYYIIKDNFKIKDDFEILDIVLNQLERKRDKIAALAVLLFKAAQNNDKLAIDIYKQAAYEHFLIIKALVNKMDFDINKDILVSYSGGVFKAKDYVLTPLTLYLKKYNPRIKLIKPLLDPAKGAAIYAIFSSGNNPDQAIKHLQSQV